MATKRMGRPKADPSRDLRADLLRIGRALLMEGGPGALSMREIARRADCTHQAPYHYFEDRETLLATLVAMGFDELARRLRAGNDQASGSGVRAALLASGHAYLDFAMSQPGVFRIMFRPDVCNPTRFAFLQEPAARAHAELQRLSSIVFGRRATPALATILWAHVHGLACLMVDGPLAMALTTAAARTAHIHEVGEQFADLMMSLVKAK